MMVSSFDTFWQLLSQKFVGGRFCLDETTFSLLIVSSPEDPKVSIPTGPLLTRLDPGLLEFSRDCSEMLTITKFRINVQSLFEFRMIPSTRVSQLHPQSL
jgi:hypothetical protein